MIRKFIEHPVATWMLFTALMLTGIYSLPRLEIEAMPETELPSVTVVTTWNGASPMAVQRSLTIPIEAAARKVHGVENIKASSRPGRSNVTISFRRDVDVEFAQLDLAEQLGAVRRDLPSSASQPRLVPYVPEEFRTGDFLTFSLISSLDANTLRDKAETWLLPRLLAITGVADAELQGGARPLLRVNLNFDLLEQYKISADAVFARINSLDDILPAGTITRRGNELTLSVQDSVTTALIKETVVQSVGGQLITVDRIADIVQSFEDPAYFVRINGDNVIQCSVAKRSGTNAVAVSRRIREALPQIKEMMPFECEFEIDTDQGKELEDKLRELVYRSLVILALLFLMLAAALRRVQLTAIVISSILLAIVICLSLFYFFDISVNFITISGLTVCFGMLLDNSILVLDAIHRRFSRRNLTATEVLVRGTGEVAFPIIATTLTTIVAFLSFIFLSGRLALYYVPLAVSVGIAMLASILVAFGWIPVALRRTAEIEMSRDHSTIEVEPEGFSLLWRWSVSSIVVVLFAGGAMLWIKGIDTVTSLLPWFGGGLVVMIMVGVFSSWVEKITRLHIRFWFYPVALLIAFSWFAMHLYNNEIDQGGFWRQQDKETLVVYLERPVGTDVVFASETMLQFERELTPIPAGITMKTTSYDNRAYMNIEFEDEMLLTEYPELYRNKIIMLAEELGGMFIWINGFGDPYMKGGRGGGNNNSVIKITGYNSKELNEICSGVIERLEKNRRVRSTRLTGGERFSRSDMSETLIVINREALAKYHLSVSQVVSHLRRLLGVEYPWHMLLDGEDQRLQLGFLNSDQIQYDQIAAHMMTTSNGMRIRLSDVVSLEEKTVVSTINREDQRYSMQITWEYVGTDKMKQKFITDIMAGIELPYGYEAEDTSGDRFTREEEEEMNSMLLLTSLFIFMTLSALFESVLLPILVLMALPMALSGVMVIFWLTDSSFDSSARIGLVLLFGIVVNNAILLINRFRLQLREQIETGSFASWSIPQKRRLGGYDLWQLPRAQKVEMLQSAIASGTKIQLRSILLTSGTTIAGMLPLLIKLTDNDGGKDIWENLALSSIGGLASSTILIISAIPVLYYIFTRIGWIFASLLHKIKTMRT
ncbi:efflux RND transporter permease subunit [bacterium]|jgi:multidrug efflux pump subunit AcrB|nr:efflux RND transporter permease subunit [bacterium]